MSGLVAINLKFLHYVPISKGKSVRRTSNNGAKYETINRYIDLFHARLGVDGGVGWNSLCGDILGVIPAVSSDSTSCSAKLEPRCTAIASG